MKKLKLLIMICSMMSVLALGAQSKEMMKIENTITAFAKAGDQNDVEKLETYLDTNFRVVMNRLFGSSEVSTMPRSVYLEKIRTKEYGGDKRELTFENLVINGSNASVKVILKGTKMTFVSLISLVQDQNGQWKLISDMPMVQG